MSKPRASIADQNLTIAEMYGALLSIREALNGKPQFLKTALAQVDAAITLAETMPQLDSTL